MALLCLISELVFAQRIFFAATGELTSSPAQLDGRVSLTLNATEPVYDVLVFARARTNKELIGEYRYWEPGSRQDFDLHLTSMHAVHVPQWS